MKLIFFVSGSGAILTASAVYALQAYQKLQIALVLAAVRDPDSAIQRRRCINNDHDMQNGHWSLKVQCLDVVILSFDGWQRQLSFG
jgi:hypothetical protein